MHRHRNFSHHQLTSCDPSLSPPFYALSVLLCLDKQNNKQTINDVGVGLGTKELEKQRCSHKPDSGNTLKETKFAAGLYNRAEWDVCSVSLGYKCALGFGVWPRKQSSAQSGTESLAGALSTLTFDLDDSFQTAEQPELPLIFSLEHSIGQTSRNCPQVFKGRYLNSKATIPSDK